jgi:hypothetical protein
MKKILLLLILCLFSTLLLASEPIPELPRLKKTKHMLTFEVKKYNISSSEEIMLYGAKERKFINESWYWGEAGYGAISGRRAGYLEGGIMSGYLGQLAPKLTYDIRLFFGAGGGGSAPQGGGMIINPTIGLGYQFLNKWNICLEVGYIHFINGNISSATMGLNISTNFWALTF